MSNLLLNLGVSDKEGVLVLSHIPQEISLRHEWHNDQGRLSIKGEPSERHHVGMTESNHEGDLLQ